VAMDVALIGNSGNTLEPFVQLYLIRGWNGRDVEPALDRDTAAFTLLSATEGM